jgi:hypothetical protein
MKMTGLWDISLRSLVDIKLRFGGVYCFHHQGDLIIEAVCTFKTTYKTVIFK